MSFKKEHRQETITYLALWILLFLAPVMSLAIRNANSSSEFNWSEVLVVWREFIPFFMLFLIHNHMIAPVLVYRQKRWQYLGLCVAMVAFFQFYQCKHHPDFDKEHWPPHEMGMRRQDAPPPPRDFDDRRPQGGMEPQGDHKLQGDFNPRNFHGPRDEHSMRDEHRPPVMFGQHDIIALIILILMMGMNVGIKFYFKNRDDHKKMEELERQNLQQQLEYLKYQINPHFFMNTLNNIHALVDIDPEKAKQTILELSKMMRFVLYEGNKPTVPLNREIDFLKNYITLMKLRYTDKVRITVKIPETVPNKEIPPLVFITFVENAFKHGVSYQQDSFINIEIREGENDRLVFICQNSRIPATEDKHGGMGLNNVKQRLDLIYGDKYALDITDDAHQYAVQLTLPL